MTVPLSVSESDIVNDVGVGHGNFIWEVWVRLSDLLYDILSGNKVKPHEKGSLLERNLDFSVQASSFC